MTSHRDESALNVYPVSFQSSDELVLKDEDENESAIVSFEDLSSSVSAANFVPASVNVENSSEVIIGPVTQFNGAVTIYQNVTAPNGSQNVQASCQINGRLVKSDSTASDVQYSSEKTSNFPPLRLKYIIVALVILITLGIIATVTIILTKPESNNEITPNDDQEGGLVPVRTGALIKKASWGGRPALNFTKPLQHPTKMVIISHTATPSCPTFIKCRDRVQNIQSYHVAQLKSPDIGYNFLIGSDANIYEGRGWDIQNFHSNDSIGISFIGNYIYDYLTPAMINVTQKLLSDGVKLQKLAKDYKLVGHKQTVPQESPGEHVMEVIEKWAHYDPNYYFK